MFAAFFNVNGGNPWRAELIVAGMRVPPPPGHDCGYVRRRNLLIVEAERVANSLVAPSRRNREISEESVNKINDMVLISKLSSESPCQRVCWSGLCDYRPRGRSGPPGGSRNRYPEFPIKVKL